ncbi:hypothetical protein D9M71_667550 [compost metagenome]
MAGRCGAVVAIQIGLLAIAQLIFDEGHGIRAEGLAHQVGDGLANLGTPDLQERAFRTGRTAIAGRGENAQVAHFGGHQLDFQFGDLRAE